MTVPLLEVSGISKKFSKKNRVIDALKPCSFNLSQGEILGIIGESGSGKSTILKILSSLESPTQGYVKLLGKETTNLHGKSKKYIYQNIQMIFQNPVGSFNPRKKLRSSILENLQCLCPSLSLVEQNHRIDSLLEKVGINPDLANRYPYNLSGGQCQRIAIARALSVHPKILLCDEITSALDVLTQAYVIELLLEFSREFNIAIIFVSHDLSLACNFCKNAMVMYQGVCVEMESVGKLFKNPKHWYTKQLIAAALDPVTYLKQQKDSYS